MSGTFEDLQVWQSSMEIVFDVYRLTKTFPDTEKFGLVTQMQRAAVSIASNIAEGKGRSSDKELCQFLGHARGSLHELHTQILIARQLNYMSGETAENVLGKIGSVGRMLNAFTKYAKHENRRSN